MFVFLSATSLLNMNSASHPKTVQENKACSSASVKKKRHHVKCPVPECGAVVKKLAQHLRNAKIHTNLTPEEQNYLSKLPRRHVEVTDEPPRQHHGKGQASIMYPDEVMNPTDQPSSQLHEKGQTSITDPDEVVNPTDEPRSEHHGKGQASITYPDEVTNPIDQPSSKLHEKGQTSITDPEEVMNPPNESRSQQHEEGQGSSNQGAINSLDNPQPSVFSGFEQYLDMCNLSIHQNIVQVKNVADKCNFEDPQDIITKKGKFKEWFLNARTTISVGTLISYIYSCKHFASYIQHEGKLKEDVTPFLMDLQVYLKSLSAMKATRKAERDAEKDTSAISVQDIIDYMNSPHCNSVRKLIEEFSENEKRTLFHFEFNNIQDYIITAIVIDNGQRTGTIKSLQVKHYRDACTNVHLDEKGRRQYILKSPSHKTARYFGPANLVLNEELFQCMQVFYQIRSKLPMFKPKNLDHLDAPLFVSWNGNPYSSSSISGRIKASFNGKNQYKRSIHCNLNGNKIRRLAVTQV